MSEPFLTEWQIVKLQELLTMNVTARIETLENENMMLREILCQVLDSAENHFHEFTTVAGEGYGSYIQTVETHCAKGSKIVLTDEQLEFIRGDSSGVTDVT